jgi:hypothetical protein
MRAIVQPGLHGAWGSVQRVVWGGARWGETQALIKASHNEGRLGTRQGSNHGAAAVIASLAGTSTVQKRQRFGGVPIRPAVRVRDPTLPP